jgi:hypothetical protein
MTNRLSFIDDSEDQDWVCGAIKAKEEIARDDKPSSTTSAIASIDVSSSLREAIEAALDSTKVNRGNQGAYGLIDQEKIDDNDNCRTMTQ